MTLKTLQTNISQIIEERTGCYIKDFEANLLNPTFHIPIPDFLYILSDLEAAFGVTVFPFLERHSYPDFTISGLATDIMTQLERKV